MNTALPFITVTSSSLFLLILFLQGFLDWLETMVSLERKGTQGSLGFQAKLVPRVLLALEVLQGPLEPLVPKVTQETTRLHRK